MDNVLYIVVGIAIPVALLLCLVLGWEVRRTLAVTNLYRAPGRDLRFVCALLRYYLPGGKWRVLRNPCLLTDDRLAPSRADLLVIGGGGVMIITVEDREGHFSTPPAGEWTLWQNGKGKRIANRFSAGRHYTAAINGILVRCGITCPVVSYVVLSDDEAVADDLYGENVFTGNQLVEYAKRFCKGRALSRKNQKRLREAIAAHHNRCREAIAEADSAAYLHEAAHLTAENLFDSLMKEENPSPEPEEKE